MASNLHEQKHPRSVGTHDGRFHADEVTACALLVLAKLADKDKIIRTREPEKLELCEYVCDVGGTYDPELKLFDHHQAEYRGSLSSAGMVLEYLREKKILPRDIADLLEHELIIGVDAHDNGKELHEPGVTTFSHVISNFNPISYNATPADEDQTFFIALDFAKGHIERMIERHLYATSCKEKVASKMKDTSKVLIFEETIPWMDSFFELGGRTHPALFVVMPAGNHWKLRGIPPSPEEKMKVRFPLPEKWAGLLEDDLKKVSGISGAVFCHKGRFISVWETKEDALKALNQLSII